MKQAKVIDGKKITTTDTAIHFKKLKSLKVGIEDYQKFLDDLAKSKKIELDDIKRKLTTCGQPGISTHVSFVLCTTYYWGGELCRFDSLRGKQVKIRGLIVYLDIIDIDFI